jgi:putative methyltransferase (TIGR04325 family)
LTQPHDVLLSLIEKKVKYILILRTPLHDRQEQIMVQKVPKSIYKSSYPIRIFNEKDFLIFFKNHNYKRVKINFRDEIIANYCHKNILFKLK